MLTRIRSALRAHLCQCYPLSIHRRFSVSAPAALDIHLEILSILREESAVETEAPLERKKNYLILPPVQTKNKEYANYVSTLGRRRKSSAPAATLPAWGSLDLVPEISSTAVSDAELVVAIENFRPGPENSAASSSTQPAVQALAASFTRAQLAVYVEQKAPSLYKVSHRKSKLAETITEKIWGGSSGVHSSFLVREHVPLSHQEMFLLLSQRGLVLRLLKSTVAHLDFDAASHELILTGTASQLQNAKINLASRFEQAVHEEIDLTALETLAGCKGTAAAYAEVGRLTEVHFQPLLGHKYELCAFSEAQVKRIKRLLVWYLDYDKHTQTRLHLPAESVLAESTLVPHQDEYSMPWKDRSQAYFALVDETTPRHVPSILTKEMHRFLESKLRSAVDRADFTVWPSAFLEERLGNNELLAQGAVSDKDPLKAVIDELVETSEPTQPFVSRASRRPTLVSEDIRTRVYNEVTALEEFQDKRPAKRHQADPPIFTVTLGRVLFPGEKATGAVLHSAPKKDLGALNRAFVFSTNIPMAYDKALHEGMALTDALPDADPHTYNLQFKFLPSPYEKKATEKEFAADMACPPLELWMQLGENKVVDVDTLQLVAVEAENNSYVCLPQHASDLKVTCQLTGRLILDGPTDSVENSAESTESTDIAAPDTVGTHLAGATALWNGLFDSPSSKYPRLRGQAGVQRFLEESRLNFSGKNATRIAPFMDVLVNGRNVRYSFVSVNYRRELDLEIGDEQMAQVSIVDGGLLGGRRAELRFVGDFAAGTDRAAFDAVMDAACRFVEDL